MATTGRRGSKPRRMEGSCRAEGRRAGGKKREERKIGKVGNRWLSLMRSLPGEWKQEKLRTGGGTYKLLDRYSVICLKQR